MLAEVLSWYLDGLTAFWSSMARLGLLRLLVVGLILWWIFGEKCRCWSCCPRCGCWCGRCRCREVDAHEGGAEAAESGAGSPEDDEEE